MKWQESSIKEVNIPYDGWNRISKDVELSIYPTNLICEALIDYSEKIYGFSPDELAFFYFDNTVEYWFRNKSYKKYGENFLKRFLSDKSFMKWVEKKHYEAEKWLIKFSRKISYIDPKRCTNKKLIELLREYNHNIALLYTHSVPISSVELEEPMISNLVLDILRKKGAEELFPIVTAPVKKSIYVKERIDYHKLRMKGKGLWNYLKKYYWIQYGFENVVLNSDIIREIIFNDSSNPKDEIKKIETEKYKARTILKKLDLDEREDLIIWTARKIVELKAIRKYITQKSICDFRKFMLEMAARLRLSFKDFMYLHENEIEDALINSVDIKLDKIVRRKKHSVYIKIKDKELHLNDKDSLELYKKIKPVPRRGKILYGTPASRGEARGLIKKVADINDSKKFREGDILVSYATNPNLVPIMNKASAILTEEGGLTCHAAIFSRELNIPCVVGVKNIMETIKDNQLVEVNATEGIIKIIG